MGTKTFMATKQNHVAKWHVIDADGQVFGRIAAKAASILRGKHSPRFTPNADCGDYVIIINCAKAVLTGNKLLQKEYIRHTGWIGGLKRVKYQHLMETRPEFAMKMAVEGMLPHTTLGREQLTHLRVYAGAEHEHEAQVNANTSKKKPEKKERVKKGGIKKEKPAIIVADKNSEVKKDAPIATQEVAIEEVVETPETAEVVAVEETSVAETSVAETPAVADEAATAVEETTAPAEEASAAAEQATAPAEEAPVAEETPAEEAVTEEGENNE